MYSIMSVVVQSKRELDQQVAEINASRPQCPVGLSVLVLLLYRARGSWINKWLRSTLVVHSALLD